MVLVLAKTRLQFITKQLLRSGFVISRTIKASDLFKNVHRFDFKAEEPGIFVSYRS